MRAVLISVAVLLAAAPAEAYEFEVRARTLAQGFELSSFRVAGDIQLARRRFTQLLSLEIRDIGDLGAKRARTAPHRRGPTISFSGYLRLDHDFGDWTMGELERDGNTVDAVDGIPELASSSLALDLLYAYVAIEDLGGGVLDLKIGRQVKMDLLDTWAFDGVTAEVHTPWHVGLELAGGLRLLDSSPLAPSAYELDGTSGADCREFVEDGAGGGSWQIIDRSRVPGTSPFTADLDYCPQREELMPTFGAALVTEGFRKVHARLSYRRSASRTVGLIGDEDRLDFPDEGLYPEPQAPKWGVDEERLALVVHGAIDGRDGTMLVTPYAGARWSLLHAVVDEAVVGTRIRLGEHAIEPEVSRSIPTFDGDSIFNVFAVEPSMDARVGYSWTPRHGALRAHGGGWVRRYDLGDSAELAGGATAGGRWTGRTLAMRLDALLDGGWGGRRAGASAGVTWRARRWARYAARASLLDIDDGTHLLHGAFQLGASWEVVDGAAFHVFTESTTSRETPFAVRVLGVLDLQFVPEILMRTLWLTVLVVAALASAALGRPRYADDGPPSPVVYPDQALPLVFTHAAHLARELGCEDCHTAAATSRSAVDNLLPGEAACRDCHDIDRAVPEKDTAGGPPARCDACHRGYETGTPPARVVIPTPNLKFSHAAHVAQGLACTGCHGDLAAEQVGLATRDQLPRMRLCLECHDGEQAADECGTCHLTDVGVLRTALPEGPLSPSGVVFGDAHDGDFLRRHGATASRNEDYCGSCHRESFCSDCHTGVVKPADFHDGDYVLTHPVDARRNTPDCSTCHRKQSFCVGCHERSGVGTRVESDFDQDDPDLRFHPANWVSLIDLSSNRHALEARANLDTCASCHREEDCQTCHTAELGSPRISPHGPGWANSARCEALARKNARMCLRCHTGVDDQGCSR